MAIQRVGVIGAGTMGNGIAHVFARSGFEVILCDVEQRFLQSLALFRAACSRRRGHHHAGPNENDPTNEAHCGRDYVSKLRA